jgi:hypothetical protein
MRRTYYDLTYKQIKTFVKIYVNERELDEEWAYPILTKYAYLQAKFTADRHRYLSDMPYDETSLLWKIMAHYFVKH